MIERKNLFSCTNLSRSCILLLCPCQNSIVDGSTLDDHEYDDCDGWDDCDDLDDWGDLDDYDDWNYNGDLDDHDS